MGGPPPEDEQGAVPAAAAVVVVDVVSLEVAGLEALQTLPHGV